MISDEPDEDADTPDDDNLLEDMLRPGGPGELESRASVRRSGAKNTIRRDWPPSRLAGLGPDLDVATLSWFKANHDDWRMAMRGVLRAWIAIKSSPKGELLEQEPSQPGCPGS
jgi:hypothetical protein